MSGISRQVVLPLGRCISRGVNQRRYLYDEKNGASEDPEFRRQRDVSRDMRDEAESSTSRQPGLGPGPGDQGRAPHGMESDASSFSSSLLQALSPNWRESNVASGRYFPPRTLKGVHNRRKRAEGSTPAEANTINLLMAQMLQTMPISPNSASNSPIGRPRARGGIDMDMLSEIFAPANRFLKPPPYVRSGRASPRTLEKLETEEDQVVLEMLDSLKEEMGLCRTDVDLLEWAKEKVFAPNQQYTSLVSDSTDPLSSPSTESTNHDLDTDVGPTFSPVYPRILAHLLSYIRRNYNNPHLVLALFHHAQTQSPESYLSGCLAPAYNEVLKTRWESFKDLEGVEAGLKEMESNGIAWDRVTAKTISKIVDEVGKEVWSGSGWQEKFGKDVHSRLARLEDRLQKDINEENRMYEAKLREKANLRMKAVRAEYSRASYGDQDGARRDAFTR